jgi:microcystin-dependent protein
MSEPYVGEIRMFAGNFAPAGWAFCNGQMIEISENDQLFALIGTTYGGNGKQDFALPNLNGRAPLHQGTLSGNSYAMGQVTGTETVTLTSAQMPDHSHFLLGSSGVATANQPAGNVPAAAGGNTLAYGTANPVRIATGSISPAGGSQPHENMQPYLCVSFIISLSGRFPQP